MTPRPPVVLYAAQSLPTSSVACAVRCYHLMLALRADGFEVDVWSHAAGTRTSALWLPFPSNRLPTPLRMVAEGLLACEIGLRLALRRVRAPQTVVVLSSPPYVTCFLAAHVCRVIGLRFVFDARDVYPEVLFNFGVLRADSWLGRVLTRSTQRLYGAALFVSTPSVAFSDVITAQVGPEDRVHVVRNGYDEALFPEPIAQHREGPFVCIFHGLLGRMHNIELLLEVADRVAPLRPDVQFVVIGYGPKEGLLRAQDRPNVRFLGQKPYTEIPAHLANADLGLAFITDTEGTDGAFPVKVYEYIGAGLPVLVTPTSEAGRLIKDLAAGAVFENSDIEAIVQTIVEAADRGPRYAAWKSAVLQARGAYGRREWSMRFAHHLDDATQRTTLDR